MRIHSKKSNFQKKSKKKNWVGRKSGRGVSRKNKRVYEKIGELLPAPPYFFHFARVLLQSHTFTLLKSYTSIYLSTFIHDYDTTIIVYSCHRQ